jgi:hypothetical protein
MYLHTHTNENSDVVASVTFKFQKLFNNEKDEPPNRRSHTNKIVRQQNAKRTYSSRRQPPLFEALYAVNNSIRKEHVKMAAMYTSIWLNPNRWPASTQF